MLRRIVTPVLALAGSAALVLGATACAPEGGNASASPSPSATATTAPSGTPTASPTATPGTVAGAECLVGTWTMDQAALDAFYADINATIAGAGVTYLPAGQAELTVDADGGFSWRPAAAVTAEVSGTRIEVSLGGQAEGSYRVEGDRVVSDAVSTDGIEVSATLDGSPTDASAVLSQITAVPMGDATFSCAGDTLTLDSTISGGTATAVLQRG